MKTKEEPIWVTEENNITFKDKKKGKIIFRDSIDHWENGFLRLLKISEKEAREFIENVELKSLEKYRKHFYNLDNEAKLDSIKDGWNKLFNKNRKNNFYSKVALNEIGPCGHVGNFIVADQIENDTGFAVVGCEQCNFAWLTNNSNFKKVKTGVVYEKEYFEGSRKDLGYGEYLNQKNWRIEKAFRLLKETKPFLTSKKTNFLDIGSGYGFFRKVLADSGYKHQGTEVSKYAIEICEKEFGFKTFLGTLEDLQKKSNVRYNVATMWDVIEHAEKPVEILETVHRILKKDGLVSIRTPNVNSIEKKVLGNNFYSFKREHFNYFSPKSVLLFLEKANFVPIYLKTSSHIFSGFFQQGLSPFELMLKGSDILVIARKI